MGSEYEAKRMGAKMISHLVAATLVLSSTALVWAQQVPGPLPNGDLTARGAKLLAEGHPEEAEPILRQAVAQEPRKALGWDYLGQDLLSMRRSKEAAECFEKAIALDDAAPELGRSLRREALDGLGLALAFDKRYGEAKKAYAKAIAWDPDFAGFPYNLACVCALSGDREGALANLDQYFGVVKRMPPEWTPPDASLDDDLKGLRGDPRFEGLLLSSVGPQPYDNPGSLLARKAGGLLGKGEYQDAATFARKAAEADPKSALAFFILGGTQEALGDSAGAEKSYENALKLNVPPHDSLNKASMAHAAIFAGKVLLEGGHPKEALQMFGAAEDAQHFHPRAFYESARALAALKDGTKALEALKRALALKDNLTAVEPPLPDPAKDPAFAPYAKDPAWKEIFGG
jgi:tetratricopeptide (TPR) repeat protein